MQIKHLNTFVIPVAMSFTLSSCTLVHTQTDTGGQATFASLGGDSENITISAEGAQIASNKNSSAFKEGTKAATAISGILSFASVSKLKFREAGLTDRAGIAADATKHQATTQAGTSQLLSNNKTSVDLANTQANKELGLSKIAADKEIALKPEGTP